MNENELAAFLVNFTTTYVKEKNRLPYHINIIDELHANENAHSRILTRLLQQKSTNGKYEIFESFITYLKNKSANFNTIEINAPNIQQEKENIDIWIRDITYAIIIENKYALANDQKEQLSRYIDITKKEKNEEQIFIIYLTPTYEKEPDGQWTWGNYYDTDLRKKRYLHLSYKEDILGWLEKKVMPEIKENDKQLLYATGQLIDYLQGKFNLRNITMKTNLQDTIKNALGINGSDLNDALRKLDELDIEIKKTIESLRQETSAMIRKERFDSFIQTLNDEYSHETFSSTDEVNIKIPFGQEKLKLRLNIDRYCQLENAKSNEHNMQLPAQLKSEISTILNEPDNVDDKIYWKRLDVRNNLEYCLVVFANTFKVIENYKKQNSL